MKNLTTLPLTIETVEVLNWTSSRMAVMYYDMQLLESVHDQP
jgi:hypothetical protein